METLTLSTILTLINGTLLHRGKSSQIKHASRILHTAKAGSIVFEKRITGSLKHRINVGEQRKISALVISPKETKIFKSLNYQGPISIIVAEKPLRCYYQVARYHRKLFNIPIVAITGSSGKTTTKEMLAAILETRGPILKTFQNYNAPPGVCYNLLRLQKYHWAGVLEMGMKSTGQIRMMCSLAKPKIGIITNIGVAHYGIAGGLKRIVQAKGELIEGLPKNGVLIFNQDDANSQKLPINKYTGSIYSFGINQPATVRAKNILYDLTGTKFTLIYKNKEYPNFFIPLIGTHNVYNALSAICVGIQMGIPITKIREGLAKMKGVRKRSQVIKAASGAMIVDDTYNANPESVKAGLETLARFSGTRKTIAVLGDMKELGKYTKQGHEQVGTIIAKLNIDYLVTVGPNAKIIATTAKTAGFNPQKITTFETKSAALKYLQSIVTGDSLVLVKASRDMRLEYISKALINGSKGNQEINAKKPSKKKRKDCKLIPSRRLTVATLRINSR